MKKRILSVLLAVVLVVSAVVITASAATYTAIKTPAIVYGTNYPAETVTQGTTGGSTATLPVTLKSNIEVSEVGADYITFADIDAVSDANLIRVKGTTIYWAKVTDGTPGAYSNYKITGDGVTEYKITGLEEGATYSIYVLSGSLRDSNNNNYRFVASDAILVQTISYVDAGKWPTPTGIGVENGKFTGLEAGKTYQYVKLAAPEFALDESAYADYDPTATTLTGGLYLVRVKAGTEGANKYQDSDAVSVLVKGANVGTLTLSSVKADDFTSGKWTFLSPLGNLSPSAKADYGFQWHMTLADQDKYNAGTFAYQLTDEELISVNDLFGFKISKLDNQGDHVKTIDPDGGEADVKGAVIFHIYGADKDTVTVPFTWRTAASTSNINIDFATAAAEQLASMDGYVYRIEIDLIYLEDGQTMADVNLRASREDGDYDELKGSAGAGEYTYQQVVFTKFEGGRIKLDARVPAATPVLSAEGTETAGIYRIFGLDAAYEYEISTDGVVYTPVAAGSTYVDVEGEGTYYVYAKPTATMYASGVASIKISGAMPAIPEGTIYYDEASGTIMGLDDISATGISTVVSYDWCRVSVDGTLSWNQTAKSDDAPIQVGPGYYAFRYAARPGQNLVAGATTYIFVYEGGSNKGSVSGATAPEGERTNNFTSGLWAISTPTNKPNTNMAYPIAATNGVRLAAAYTPNVDNIAKLAWLYQLADDEVFPLYEFSSLKFLFGFENGNSFNSSYMGYVRIYIADGDEAYYDVPFVANNREMFTVDVASIWADEVALDPNFTPAGYVVGLAIHYFSESNITGLEVTSPSQNYAVLTLNGFDTTTKRSSSFITLKKAVDITTIKTVPAVGTYGGEIIGLDPEAIYQIATYDEATSTLGTWQFAPIGTYVNLPAGTYAIRSYADATHSKYLTSDYVIVTIDPAPAGDERVSAKVDKIILPEEVELSDANYIFDINESRWINRIALSNIVAESPDANIIFQADDYRFIIAASDIDLSLDTAHYFDMKVTFDGESAYDRMYSKMAAIADEKELVKGVHFESSTPYFFEKATFELYLGDKYDGYDVELRSYNERVNRLRNEETVTVDGGWASFTTFGGDYLVLCPAMAEEE